MTNLNNIEQNWKELFTNLRVHPSFEIINQYSVLILKVKKVVLD